MAGLQDDDALSVRAVTARAGVSPTALYLHFDDKEQLLAAVKQRCVGELRGYVVDAVASPGAAPRMMAVAVCTAYLQFAAELPGHYRALFQTGAALPDAVGAGAVRVRGP